MTKKDLLREAKQKTECELVESIDKGVIRIALTLFSRYPDRVRFIKAWDKIYAMVNIMFDYSIERVPGEKYIASLTDEERIMVYVAIRQICINTFERSGEYV